MNAARRRGVDHRSRAWIAWRLVRGLLATLALVAGLAGVPWGLLSWTHWPVSGIPTWEQLSDFPTALVTQDSVLVGILIVGLWVAWAMFAVCVVIEIVREVRGREALRLPGGGPLQGIARTLVASVVMTFGSLSSLTPSGAGGGGPATQAAATAVPHPGLSHHAVADSPPAHATEPASSAAEAEQPRAAWRTVAVEHGDTPWHLAERYYGDGIHWTRLWEDNRQQLQPGGSTWANQADPIEPGWQLRIRTNGVDAAPTAVVGPDLGVAASPGSDPSAAPGARSAEVTVERGDSLWRLAENHMIAALGRPATPTEVGPYWQRVIEANRDRLVERDNPDLILPGQIFVLPEVDQPASGGTAPGTPTPGAPTQGGRPPEVEEAPHSTPQRPDQPTTTGPPATEPPRTPATTDPGRSQPTTTATVETARPSPVTEPVTDDDDSDDLSIVTMLATVTGIALAVGVTRAIQRRRRRRNHLHPNTEPRPSSHPKLHRELIVAADEDAHSTLRRALYDLATAIAVVGAEGRPRIVQHDAYHLDALLDVPIRPAAEGWTAQADGAIWGCSPAQLVPSDDNDEPATTPLLVTLGQPDDHGQLYLDLEAEGVVSIVGDPAATRDVVRAMVTELAHSPLADGAQIMVIGNLAHTSLARLDRVTAVDDWGVAAANLRAWCEQSHEALVYNDWGNPFLARGQDADHDALIPLLVVTDQLPDDAETLSHLAAMRPCAAALVVLGEVDDAHADVTVIHCTADRLTLPQLCLDCTPQTLDDEHLDAIADLLDDAEDPAGEQLRLLPDEPVRLSDFDTTTGEPVATGGNGGPYQDPPYDVLVRVLGDVAVEGAPTKPTPKQTAVIAYIALHRTVTIDRASDALWREPTPSRRRRLINAVNAARTAIGGEHLPIAADGTYRAGPRLLTDIDLLTRRLATATDQPVDEAIHTLRGALDLVRGPIFTYPSGQADSYAWITTENWASTWELKIAALARELISLCMDIDDIQQAIEVAQQARQIAPGDTGLTELLMRAHAANGDRVAVQRVYQEHLEALQQLDLDDPAESTVALYNELRRATG